MQKLKAIFTSKWFVHGLGLLTLAVLIWFVGPLISIAGSYFLDGVLTRVIVILVIFLIYGANELRKILAAKKKNKALIDELGGGDSTALAEESDIIQERFHEAVDMLKSTSSKGRGNGYLYELPWYIIIGPPGSGKTTALLNSGLEFPLEEKIGLESVKGLGGTRHCDWWFTSEAVLIDTAGRFTTQDSQEDVDKTAWQSFMGMLKKFRKERPINGALVAVSITDLLTLTEHERMAYAKTIRKRIEELNQQLNIEFPIYFMFTKCDLIAGFNEFFDSANAHERAQVWGHTFDFPADGKMEFVPQDLELELEALSARLKSMMLDKVSNCRDKSQKASILNFPGQFASLKVPVVEFINDIFAPNRFQRSALLRGVYFTSGTQQGTPFDQLLGNMAESMGLSSDSSIILSGKGKSFFIRDLLSKVMFPESEIAGVDQRFKKLMQRLHIFGYSMAAVVLIAVVGLWYVSYTDQTDKILQTEVLATEFEDKKLRSERAIGADFRRIIAELNIAKQSTGVFRVEAPAPTLGMTQASSFNSQTDNLYRQSLQNTLLPFVKARLEEILIDIINQGDTTLLYDVLKAYLMYAGEHVDADAEYEPDWLLALSLADWSSTFALEPELIAQLAEHHKALIESNFQFITPDKTIVSAARGVLKRLPVSEQVYQNVKQSLTQDRTLDLYVRDITGNFGLDVFKSRSGTDLNTRYISGLFTKEGFYKAFIPKSAEKAQDYIDNNWVLGKHNSRADGLSFSDLQEDLYMHYYQDYVKQWNDLLRDLTFIEPDNYRQGVSIIEQATSINGPIEALIYTVAKETELTAPLSTGVDNSAVADGLGAVSATAQQAANRANRIARATQNAGITALPGEFVEEQFAVYHRLTSTARGEAPVNRILIDARNFALYVNQIMFDGFSNTAAFDAVQTRVSGVGRDPFASLLSGRSLMSSELRSMLDNLSGIGWRMFLKKAREEINLIWQQEILVDYDKAISGRYPFEARTDIEVELRDFSSFFRPDGQLDKFVKQYLSPFVNMRSSQWGLKSVDGESLGLSSSTISQLQMASQITELFFPANGLTPRLTLTLTPRTLDGNVKQFLMTLGNQQVMYAHGPRRARKVVWPLDQGDERTMIQFTDLNEQIGVSSKEGPWSLFRLIDEHELTPTSQNSMFQISFEIDGYKASYDLRADTEFNPIGGRLLQNLRLPREL